MQEFKHSVRVPRHYKHAASILQKVLTEGASVKTLLFEEKLKHFRTNVLYALISSAIKYNADIGKLFEETEILKNEPRLDVWLAKILTVELLFGKKALPGKSKPELTVASYKEQFEKHFTENPDQVKKEGSRRPRYVRINTNLLTTSDAIRAFQDEEYRFLRCTSVSYNDYLEQVKGLREYDFMQDYHVKTMFVFAPGTKLHEHELYLQNKIILQDKATAMAVQLLAPPPGSVVLDMCAAPGMKTTQVAAYLKNQGKVYAVERDAKRYKVLCDFVEKTGSSCVQTINKDVLEIKRGDYSDVDHILLDPSCSGSGMDLCGHKYVEDEARLARLTSLQEKFLKHALNAFPKVKRIVYSTCSIFPQENERVVTNVVNQCRIKWNVLNVKDLLKDQWNNFGTGMYGSMGPRCMYARPDSDFTTGFFLAVLEKDPKYFMDPKEKETENNVNSVKNDLEINKKKKKKHQSQEIVVCDSSIIQTDDTEVTEETANKDKKKKRQSQEIVVNDSSIIQTDDTEVTEETANKDKKKKRQSQEIVVNDSSIIQTDDTEVTEETANKDKKKKRQSQEIVVNDSSIIQTDDTEVTEETANKDKKKKRQSQEIVVNDSSIIQTDDTEVTEETANKDKKKKRQSQEIVVNDSSIIQTDDTEVTEETANKDKKKKRQSQEIVVNDSSIIQTDDTEVTEETANKDKKKKKKRVHKGIVNNQDKMNVTQDFDIIQVQIDESNNVHERKIKKNYLEKPKAEIMVADVIEVDMSKKKKNKRKDKDVIDITAEQDANNVEVICGTEVNDGRLSTKKKKRKNLESEIAEAEVGNNEKCIELQKKKKKNKKAKLELEREND